MFSASPFKKVQKTFTKTIQRATDFLSSVGPSPPKSLRTAILNSDEEKAIEVYQAEVNGASLQYDLQVSLPFPIKAFDDQTPMHLAALKALEQLILLFLQRTGNPNALNSNSETSLHSLCQESNQDHKRRRILQIFLEWRGCNEFGEEEIISVNRVDQDGNTPLHYASKNGLMECILYLTANNAIISIVNKDQMTCCEIAEANNHIVMADILEIALIFPPPDQDILLYDDDESRRYHQQISSTKPYFLCDSQTYPFETLHNWRGNCVERAEDALALPTTYIEVILDHFNWDLERAIEEMLVRRDEVLEQLHLSLQDYKPIKYVLKLPSTTIKQSQQQQETPQDVTDLNDIFVDIDEKSMSAAGNITSSLNVTMETKSQKRLPENVVQVKDPNEVIGSCSICGDDMYPTFSPQEFLNKSLSNHGQREIRCGAGHNYCSTCWIHHWTLQINDNSAPFLNCMAYKCGEIFSSSDWAIPVLGETLAEKLNTNQLRRVVDSSSTFRWCPAKDCNSILCVNSTPETVNVANTMNTTTSSSSTTTEKVPTPIQLSQTAICGNGHSFCLLCNGESHAPCSCEHWISWTEKIQREMSEVEGVKSDSGVDMASALWVAANTKKCPRCQTPIEKNEGCNHMTCRKCRYEFCWICFQDWDKHSNRTGGYFQCTIYGGNTTSESGPDDETPRIDPNDDYGSAATEAYRQRDRSHLMDRFINHYTRFRAHSDSLILELKMHATNLNRIRNSLHSSAVGTTPWLQGSTVNHPYGQIGNFKDSNSSNESFLCPEEEMDKSLIFCGDWDEPKESPLLFLQKGFRELIKCRQILKGSFPLSFYMMPDDVSNNHWRNYDYEAAQRRAYAESRHKEFLAIQSDLESLTETLSDVVARRRLRASASQITRATYAARLRRLDFESTIKKHYEAYSRDKIAESKDSQRTRTTTRKRSTGSSRLELHHSFNEDMDNSLQRLIESLAESGLAEDDTANEYAGYRRRSSNTRRPEDYDTLMSAHARITRAPPRRSQHHLAARRTQQDDLFRDYFVPEQQQQQQQQRSTTPDANTNTNPTSRSIRQELLNAGWSESDIRREGFDDEVPAEQPRESSRRSRRQNNTNPTPTNTADTSSPAPAPSISPSSSFNQMNEFDAEEDINRAILMSLQERQPTYASVERPEPPSELVQLLVDMGFSRDLSVQTLKDYGENVEDAIMYLTSRR